jgi:hypothetical protein
LSLYFSKRLIACARDVVGISSTELREQFGPAWEGSAIVRAANDYRKYAEECLHWACDAGTDEERKAFLDMARTWIQAEGQHDSAFARALERKDSGREKSR